MHVDALGKRSVPNDNSLDDFELIRHVAPDPLPQPGWHVRIRIDSLTIRYPLKSPQGGILTVNRDANPQPDGRDHQPDRRYANPERCGQPDREPTGVEW